MKQRKLENRYQDTLTLEEQVLVYHMELSSLSCMLERSRSLKVFKTKKMAFNDRSANYPDLLTTHYTHVLNYHI